MTSGHTFISDEEFYYAKAQGKRKEKKEGPINQTIDFISEQFASRLARVLEIGCGITDIFMFLPERVSYYGIDPSEFSIKKLKDTRLNLNLAVGYAENLPFESNFFDVIFSFQVLEHLYDPKKALFEMVRVTKPEGFIIISAPNLECPWNMPNAVRHYSGIRKLTLMFKRFGDLFLRNFRVLRFRMIRQNYAQWSGKFEKSDDDLTYITSAYEVATFLRRGGCKEIYSKEFKYPRPSLKNKLKKVLRKIPVLRYYDSGMFLVFQKKKI